nr:AAA family ATPase [Malacoplasma sp.]
MQQKELVEKHLKTHSERSAEDCAAVHTLEYFLGSKGKINTAFSSNDKWPNVDGEFELVPFPEISRRPLQKFIVQIKGTSSYEINSRGEIKYSLQNLGFPAYAICSTFDPCILFVVFNLGERGQEKIYWKYLSTYFLGSINFNNNSHTITFTSDEEIENSDISINNFVQKLVEITENYSFSSKLEIVEHSKEDIINIINNCDSFISEAIDRVELYNDSRENISRRMLNWLDGLCSATLLLNAISLGYNRPNKKLAWELSLLNIETKFLGTFYQKIRYIDGRIPQDGQTERLMLRYYDFLWQIRKLLKKLENIDILKNLECFPLDMDEEEKDYYIEVAEAINKISRTSHLLTSSRYYIQKKQQFFIGKERYYEITLQLADRYATKFNRFTIYTKENISTNYSLQIGYEEVEIKLWSKTTNIKVVTNWKVSIDPGILNKFTKLLCQSNRLSSRYIEYVKLMDFLTKSGINFLDLIDMNVEHFNKILNEIYFNCTTNDFKNILILLQQRFSSISNEKGRNVIRYILLRLREEIIDDVTFKIFDRRFGNMNLFLTSACKPFDDNPILYNLPRHKTNNSFNPNDIIRVIGLKNAKKQLPYLQLKKLVETTGETYVKIKEDNIDILSSKINEYNQKLSSWDRGNGNSIELEGDMVYIKEYEEITLQILKFLIAFSIVGNAGQTQLNNAFIREVKFSDELKKEAISNAFVNSRVLMIYGAAGTGKTTLINYLSELMKNSKKVFLAKTHAALENLKRCIQSPGQANAFIGVDKFIKSKISLDYNVIFIDECSTIDNRSMLEVLKKINPNALLVLAGDIYQIEAIEFGNWFRYAKSILKSEAIVELSSNWRTKDQYIKSLWDEVRNRGKYIDEKLAMDGPYSERIGENLFEQQKDDEIVLCLNYDGRLGLNNINRYFQDLNTNSKSFIWKEWSYKIGDPILFNDSKRFPRLYNNLKGKIVNIVMH